MLGASVVGLSACTDGAPGAMVGFRCRRHDDRRQPYRVRRNVARPGQSAGYAPAQLSVPVGTQIRFVNTDSFAHTASAVAGTTFPASSPLTAQRAHTVRERHVDRRRTWSSGNLAAGASSPVFVADRPGTYLFGCFYHYGAPMRAAIVVH